MEHPDLAVRMTTSNELCDLRGGDADVAVRAEAAAGRAWRSTGCRVRLHAHGQSRCLAEVERKLGRKLEPADLPAKT